MKRIRSYRRTVTIPCLKTKKEQLTLKSDIRVLIYTKLSVPEAYIAYIDISSI